MVNLKLILVAAGAIFFSESHAYRPELRGTAEPALSGEWYQGDGLGFNLHLELREDGTYTGTWTGCLGEYGKSFGNWAAWDGQIRFQPLGERGLMEGHLRVLEVEMVEGGETILLRPEDRQALKRFGVHRFSCLRRLERNRHAA